MSFNNFFKCLDEDIKFGSDSEIETLPALQQQFDDDTIVKTTERYCGYDYEGKNKRIELKSRRNSSSKYLTTMLSTKKVKDAEIYNGEYFFAFQFTDGLFFIKYNKEVFETFEKKQSGRADRGKVETSDYIYIPISLLTEV